MTYNYWEEYMALPRESAVTKKPPASPSVTAYKKVTVLLAELQTLLKTSRTQYQALLTFNRENTIKLNEDLEDISVETITIINEFKAQPNHDEEGDKRFIVAIDQIYQDLLTRIRERHKAAISSQYFGYPVMDKFEEINGKIRTETFRWLRTDKKKTKHISTQLQKQLDAFNAFYHEIKEHAEVKIEINELDNLLKTVTAESKDVLRDLRKFSRDFAKRQKEDNLSDKIAAFKRIYHAIRQGQTSLINSDFMADKKNISDEALEKLIAKQIKKFPKGRVAKAWNLAKDKTNQAYCNHSPQYYPEELFKEMYQIAFEHSGRCKKSNLLGVSIFNAKKLKQQLDKMNHDELYEKVNKHKQANKNSRTAKLLTAYYSFKMT